MRSNFVSELKDIKLHQDYLISYGFNKVAHDQRLITSSCRLMEDNSTVNQNRYTFYVSSLECFGYLVDGNSFKPDIK